MSAEATDKYSQPVTASNIVLEADSWAKNFATLSEEELCDKAAIFARHNVRQMNWAEDDIQGVAWFLGYYTRVILKAGLSDSFATIMTTSMRKYFNMEKTE